MKFKNAIKLFTLILHYRLFEVTSYDSLTTTFCFVNDNVFIGGDSNGSNSSYGPVFMLISECLLDQDSQSPKQDSNPAPSTY
jgi:hypothetical protein